MYSRNSSECHILVRLSVSEKVQQRRGWEAKERREILKNVTTGYQPFFFFFFFVCVGAM